MTAMMARMRKGTEPLMTKMSVSVGSVAVIAEGLCIGVQRRSDGGDPVHVHVVGVRERRCHLR